MKVVGKRIERKITLLGSGAKLAAGATFSESIAMLSQPKYMLKGVYRFATHAAANKHEQDCVVRAISTRSESFKHG